MKVRNRNYISAIRKKFEQLEDYKKNYIKNRTPFTEIDVANSLIREVEFELNQIKGELLSLHNTCSGIDNRLVALEESEKRLAEKFGDKFIVSEDSYSITYPELYLERNGRKLSIGVLTAVIKKGYFSISFSSNNPKNRNGSRYEHPHITYGSPCLGSFNTPMYRAYDQADLFTLSDLIWEFLNSYNESSTFLKLSYWDDQIRYCEGCGYLEEDCECDTEEIYGEDLI